MLSKLIKHEFKATARYFLPLFVIVLLLTPITRLTHNLGGFFKGAFQFIPGIITFAYVASIMVVIAACGLIIVYRFYKSMVTEEGYLMHTLPVSPAQHIWSKLLVSAFWSITSILVVLLSIIMMFYQSGDFTAIFREFGIVIQELSSAAYADMHFNIILILIEVIVLMLIGIITAPLVFYASIAIGQVISKNKVIGSVAGFFIIQIASQILMMITFAIIGFFMRDTYINDYHVSDVVISSMVAKQIMPLAIVLVLAVSAAYFTLTNYVFKRKLNLE